MHVIFVDIMDLVVLVSSQLLSLCLIQPILNLFPVLGDSHFLFACSSVIYDGSNVILLLIFVRQVVNEFISILQDTAVLHELVCTHVTVCYYWINLVVGFVVSIIRYQASTTVLLKTSSIR